jgi:diguanylate cyclase (GGDEF)-like protein
MIRRYNNKRAMHFQMTIIFLDMDNFKFYNDTYGHEAGDLLISKFGELLKKVFRKVDFISRFGGDEFVILLPNTNCPEAHRAAERVHKALEESNYFITDLEDLLGKKLDVPENRILGFSTGICSNFDIENPTDMETVMSNADQALYYSKQTQKGSITIWSDIKHLLPQLSDLPKPGRE